MTDSTGNATDTYSYEAWGNVTSHIGPTSQPYQYVGRLGYYTHYQEPEFGLMQLGVRFYDSEVGRFTQRDPKRIGPNCYGYVSAEVTSATDPTGLDRVPINPDRDVALSKCLRRIGRCLSQFADTITSVKWYLDSEISGGAETRCGLLGGRTIVFNLAYGEAWSQRYDSVEQYHSFCTTVLHELIHASHGFWRCTYCDAWKEYWDPFYFQRQAEQLYRRNRGCLSDG